MEKKSEERAPAETKPIVKWAGGKSQLVAAIAAKYPSGFGCTIKKYAEPFVGGGAVLFDVLNKYDLDEVYISDSNAELINMYRKIQTDVDTLAEQLSAYQEQYLPLSDAERKTFYYGKREEYNQLIRTGESKDSVTAAALFIFLNRTCFNGLYRVNKNGLFNVPVGAYKNPCICDRENLRAVNRALQKVTIVCGDFKQSEAFIDANTLVYFDPPYRPLSVTANFTSYTENLFDDTAQEELASYATHLADKGAFVILSNSDPKNTNPDDDFFDELYKKFYIHRIPASRMINSNAKKRGKINELLICSF